MKQKLLVEIAEETVGKLQEGYGDGTDGADLHHELWNTDYYIIGTHKAQEWIDKYYGFSAVSEVTGYEKEQFGETYTDISSPENVANMLAYICGEEVLNCSKTLDRRWNKRLDNEDINEIIQEITEHYGL